MKEYKNKDIEQDLQDVEFVEEDGEGNIKDLVKSLRERLSKAISEKQEYLNNWQRERADFLNYKKDENERLILNTQKVKKQFIVDLLPVLDSYDLAFSNKELWEKVDKTWRVGIEYIHMQLLKILENYGVSQISCSVGEKFNPSLHESIENVKGESNQIDTISEIIQSGYFIDKKVLRPVRVKVFGV